MSPLQSVRLSSCVGTGQSVFNPEHKLCHIECEMTQPALRQETLDELTGHYNYPKVVSPPQSAEDLCQQDPDQERMEEQELVGSVTKNLQV